MSSKAAVNEYCERPRCKGSGSKVPMQPRKDLWPEREITLQVTNIGYEAVTETVEAYEERRSGVEGTGVVACVDVEFALEGVEVPDADDGVESRTLEMDGSCSVDRSSRLSSDMGAIFSSSISTATGVVFRLCT